MRKVVVPILVCLMFIVGGAAMAAADDGVVDAAADGDVGIMAYNTWTLSNGCKIQGGNGHGTVSIGTHYPWAETTKKNSTCDRINAFIRYKRKSDGQWIDEWSGWTSQSKIRVTASYAASTYNFSMHGGRVGTNEKWETLFK